MVKVLHFDYEPQYFERYRDEMNRLIASHPEIEYEWFETDWSNFIKNRGGIENLLSAQDVLLIHPGVRSQRIVLTAWPLKYPHLKIGLITSWPVDYKPPKEKGRVRFLDYQDPQRIIDFILGK